MKLSSPGKRKKGLICKIFVTEILGCIPLRVKRYGTITGIVETIRYFIGTAIGILNYAK